MASLDLPEKDADKARVLTEDDVSELAVLLNDIAPNWEFFLGLLKVSRTVRGQIKLDHAHTPNFAQICLLDGLEHWVTSDQQPTLGKIISALTSDAIDNKALALKLNKKLGSNQAVLEDTVETPTECLLQSAADNGRYQVTGTPQVQTLQALGSHSVVPAATAADPGAFPGYSAEDLQARLEDDLQMIQNRFATLLSGTRVALRSKGISPLQVATCAMDLSHITSNKKTSVLQDHREEIMNSDSIDRLFIALSPFWSFLNYDLLKHVIMACGIDAACVSDYEEALEEFCRRGVIEVPPHSLGSPQGNNLKRDVLHMKIDLEHPTLKQVRNARQKIAKILRVEPTALFIHKLEPGCVEVEFLVPQCVTQLLFPLQDDQKHSLYHDVQVLKLQWKETAIDFKALFGQRVKSEEPADDRKPKAEWRHLDFMDSKWYGIYGPKDVLLISSSGVNHPHAVAHTPPPQRDSEADLSSFQDPLCNDFDTMKDKYSQDKTLEIAGVEQSTSERPLTTSYVKSRIKELFRTTKKTEVILYYHGPGRKDTGDWCFADSFITFEDIADLYTKHFKWSLLIIHTDCSYSGSWVKSCGEFLDKQGVQPCGHSARDKGILIKLHASCRANEVAQSLYFSRRVIRNEQNTKKLSYETTTHAQLDSPQHYTWLDSTTIRCSSESIDQPCSLPTDYTWEIKQGPNEVKKRVRLIRSNLGGKLQWHYLLLQDEEDSRFFEWETASGLMDPVAHGMVLRSGPGKDPPKEDREWFKTEDFTKYT